MKYCLQKMKKFSKNRQFLASKMINIKSNRKFHYPIANANKKKETKEGTPHYQSTSNRVTVVLQHEKQKFFYKKIKK